jgi:hypothetical protein
MGSGSRWFVESSAEHGLVDMDVLAEACMDHSSTGQTKWQTRPAGILQIEQFTPAKLFRESSKLRDLAAAGPLDINLHSHKFISSPSP